MKLNVNFVKYLELIEKYTIYISLFLLPIIFLPIFENVYDTSKLLVLVFGATIVLITKIVKSIIKKGLEFNSSKLDLPVLIFIIVFLLSGIFAVVNRIDAFVFPGVASFATLAGIYYFLVNQLSKEDREKILTILLASGFVVATLQISSFLGITKLIPQLPEFIKANTFTPYGNILSSIVFLIMLLPLLIQRIVKGTELPEKILSIIVAVIFLTSISSSIYLILPNKSTSISILDYKTSWVIAIDSLKANPLLGVGPGNYNQAFLKYKPVEFNAGPNWNLKYLQGSDSLLTIFTEAGILGLLTIIFIFGYALKKNKFKEPLYVSMLILALGLLFLPLSSSLLPVIFIILALNSNAKDSKLAFFIKRYAILFLGLPIILLLITLGYLFGRALYGEFLYTQAVKQINLGQGLPAYELVNRATFINPYSDRYHLLSAGIDLAIAENIAKKEDLKDADKTTISQLIQQSIAEGKASVSVNPQKSSNWDALSGVYQSIIAFAEDADKFAIQSLNQAIFLEPTNPLLRIKLGGIYYSQGKYEDAVKSFELAVLAKPDLANSHYNLAVAYKDNKQLEKAKEQINITMNLLGKDSKDYATALKELENIEGLTAPVASPEATISEDIIDPKIEIPQDLPI